MGTTASRPSSPGPHRRGPTTRQAGAEIDDVPDFDRDGDGDGSRTRPRPGLGSRLSSFGLGLPRSNRPGLLKRKSSSAHAQASSSGEGEGHVSGAKRDSRRFDLRNVRPRESGEYTQGYGYERERERQEPRAEGKGTGTGMGKGTAPRPSHRGTSTLPMSGIASGNKSSDRALLGTHSDITAPEQASSTSASSTLTMAVPKEGTQVPGKDVSGQEAHAAVPRSNLTDPVVIPAAPQRDDVVASPRPTPSLPTSPGPPVLHQDQHQVRTSSSCFSSLPAPMSTMTPSEAPHSVSTAAPSSEQAALPPDPTYISLGPSSTMPLASASESPAGVSHAGDATSMASPTAQEGNEPNAAPSTRLVRPTRNRGLSLPSTSSANQRTITGRLSAMLGFSAPAAPELLDSPPPTAVPTVPQTPAVERRASLGTMATIMSGAGEVDAQAPNSAGVQSSTASDGGVLGGMAVSPIGDVDQVAAAATPQDDAVQSDEDAHIANLRRELDDIESEVARVSRQIEQLNERRRELARQPVGAMLVIQGLAQTQVTSSDDDGSEMTAGRSVEGVTTRRPNGPGSSSATQGDVGTATSQTSSPAAGPAAASGSVPRRPAALRRMSDGSLLRRRREQAEERGASLDQQARMIGGLLTVAAAATANTLLQPAPQPAPPARSGMGGAIDNLINRLRPNRSPRHGIEQALGSYLRGVARDNRRSELTGERNRPGSAGSTSNQAAANAVNALQSVQGADSRPELDADFQQFLEDLQNDLVGAVREFAANPADDESELDVDATARGDAASVRSVRAEHGNTGAPTQGPQAVEPQAVRADSSDSPQAFSADPSIPTFHRQLGQNLPRSANGTALGLTGGRSTSGGAGAGGSPRQLNFFRAHLFPPTSQSEAARQSQLQEGEADDTIVPCIFVGVRSMQHDPDLTTEEIVQSPGFPFAGEEANTPPATANGSGSRNRSRSNTLRRRMTGTGSLTAPSTPALDVPRSPFTPGPASANASAGGSDTAAGSYFDRMPPRSSTPTGLSAGDTAGADAYPNSHPVPTSPSATSRPGLPRMSSGPGRSFRDRVLARLNRRPPVERPMNTYLVYVVGGNYPRNHPVLRIPALLTGGALTDEEMTLIGELLGPAKPPTASKEDIENSGLRLVDGRDIAELGEKGEVHENTVERCLVCLGDYEDGEECRVLQCKHVYHRECVDRWLEQGANSCPACRNQAVERSADSTSSARPADSPSSGIARPALSRAASSASAAAPITSPSPLSRPGPVPLHSQASGLLPSERPLSVVPESDSASASATSTSAPSPVPSLTEPIDVASIPAACASAAERRRVEGKDE